ncbi:hypothetical protein CO710_03535 [Acetobacter orleanensis]|nr:hypothetical protein CO710_03535 [Acetobacter orleanensis]
MLTLGSIATTAIATRLSAQAVLPPPPQDEGRRILPVLPGPKPVVITSDSAAFCFRLSRVIESYNKDTLPRMVSQLQEEGTDLCRQGLVRSGISRLRRAIISLKRTSP